MYLAQTLNSQDLQAPLYITLLENLIDDTNLPAKENVDRAIVNAREVALNKKDIYSIDHKHYYFISTLLINYFEGLKRLNGNNFSSQIYSEILDALK
ncbi:hypothetical protein [Salinimicrobium sp. GXAS 041]|uniref:hypothetical protein n=1 Tax=Salinimicrobium sp. GXAS 041 TaxID=3400806 RepID=UPI003C731713